MWHAWRHPLQNPSAKWAKGNHQNHPKPEASSLMRLQILQFVGSLTCSVLITNHHLSVQCACFDGLVYNYDSPLISIVYVVLDKLEHTNICDLRRSHAPISTLFSDTFGAYNSLHVIPWHAWNPFHWSLMTKANLKTSTFQPWFHMRWWRKPILKAGLDKWSTSLLNLIARVLILTWFAWMNSSVQRTNRWKNPGTESQPWLR